jgi:predicted transcriptional regulator
MKIFCEIMLTQILPAIKAIAAREMLKKYHMTQLEIAKVLGVTQAAISQYKNKIRGRQKSLISNKKIKSIGIKVASDAFNNNIKLYERICDICKEIRKEDFIGRKYNDSLCLLEIRR